MRYTFYYRFLAIVAVLMVSTSMYAKYIYQQGSDFKYVMNAVYMDGSKNK